MKAAAAPALITKSFTRDELDLLTSTLADGCQNIDRCPCDGDPNCRPCAVFRSTLKKLAPVNEVCMFCLCTENKACLTEHGPCSWADEAHTICSNPRCIEEAEKELGIGALNKARRA